MTELFDDEEKALIVDDEIPEDGNIILDNRQRPVSRARKRLEDLMEEKRLRSELEDFIDL